MTDEIVTVATSSSLAEAEARKLRLESDGLTVYLADAETIGTYWGLLTAVGSIKIQVPQAQVGKAMTVLEQVKLRHDDEAKQARKESCLACAAEMPLDAAECPACGWSYAKEDVE
jgi:hypothetical protein